MKYDPLPLDAATKQQLESIARTIRHLTIDAVERAGSGHPGLPLGCADLGAYLYGFFLRHTPENPKWLNRDRFVLSAGHGSLLQYICLHLAGYNLSVEDLKAYRKGGSKTPSHPQSTITEGVETTTGADGHGVANAVGIALGLTILQKKFFPEESLLDSKVVVLAGDGCLMEGISSEACALAGHLNLCNLILIYDSNQTCLDGYVSEVNSEDTAARYCSYGWDTVEIDGHDFEQIHAVFQPTRLQQTRPLLVIAKTVIGRGAPHKQGSPASHGQPLGTQEAKEAKKLLGLPDKEFYVPPEIYQFCLERKKQLSASKALWNEAFEAWGKNYPQLREEWSKIRILPSIRELEEELKELKIPGTIPTRFSSHTVLNFLASRLPHLYGGSADLAKSDGTQLDDSPFIGPPRYAGRNIKYGVREFAMGAMAIGLSQTEHITPFIGTFLVFSDYMRHSIRMAALMRKKVIFHLTHDSIFVSEDGPTHQPIEHIASLRAIPGLQVIRPADQHEIKHAWIAALHWEGPTALILSRQPLPELKQTQVPYDQGLGKGAYVIKEGNSHKYDFTFFATGSEVHLVLEVVRCLDEKGYNTRVISVPSWEIFERQTDEYKKVILEGSLGQRISVEAGVKQGWERYIGREGISISLEEFGVSGSLDYMKEKFGFTTEAILKKILPKIHL